MNKPITGTPTTPQQDKYHSIHPYEDEISLIDIWRVLVKQKLWIFSITIIATIGAIIIALLLPRVYKAEAVILPPHSKDIEALNITDVNEVTVEDVYQEMIRNLQSRSLRRSYFDDHNLVNSLAPKKEQGSSKDEVFKKFFNEKIALRFGQKKESDFITITMEGKDPGLIAECLNGLVTLTNDYTIRNFIQGIEKKLEVLKTDLMNRIEILRNSAKQRRLDRIAVLEEALVIAKQLDFIEREKSATNFGGGSAAQLPLYLAGVKELSAEKEMLQKRKNGDAFIPNIRGMQEKLEGLKQTVLDASLVQAVRIDQYAIPPKKPIKPKRKLIVLFGGIVGLMLGLFFALLKNSIEQQRIRD